MEGVKDNKKLFLITTKVSNHTKAHTEMQQFAVSFNFAWLWESPQSIEKENTSLHHAATNARKPKM